MPNLISWYALHPRAERLILDANQSHLLSYALILPPDKRDQAAAAENNSELPSCSAASNVTKSTR